MSGNVLKKVNKMDVKNRGFSVSTAQFDFFGDLLLKDETVQRNLVKVGMDVKVL